MFVFGYGSLLWNPGFPHAERRAALARGWQRRWCVRSTVHRGTADMPGYVLGLIPGGACVGAAYRLRPEHERAALAYLDRRELCERGYRKETIEVMTDAGPVRAVCYVAEEATAPDDARLARSIRLAKGLSGTNLEYFRAAQRAVNALDGPPGWPPPCAGFPPGIRDQFAGPLAE